MAKEQGLYPVQFVSLRNNHQIMRSDYRAYDSICLNRKGYKLLALDMSDKIKPMMINTEWQVWKPKLTSSSKEVSVDTNGLESKKQQ